MCETFVKLGVNGEQILLDVLKNAMPVHYKLKEIIINSL